MVQSFTWDTLPGTADAGGDRHGGINGLHRQKIDPLQPHLAGEEILVLAQHHPAGDRVLTAHEGRLPQSDPQPLALADRVMDDTLVAA